MPQGCFSRAAVSESSNSESSLQQISRSDKSHLESPCSVPRSFGEKKHIISNCWWCFSFFLFFPPLGWLESRCAFHLKTRRLSDLTIHSYKCWFFLLYLVHVYIVSCIAQQRNNIKCIIFVVLHRLCVVHPSPTVTGYRARETPNPFVCSQSSSSQVRFDSSVIERDIYLYSPHCTRQIKWVCVCTHGAKQMVIRRDLWLTGTMNEDKHVPVSLPRRRGTFHTSVGRFITSIETFLGHTWKMQVQGRNPVRQIIQIWAWQNIIM